MKTSDFVKKIEELGFKAVYYKGYLEVQVVNGTSRKLVATVKTSSEFYIDTGFVNFENLGKPKKKRLFDILIDYAKTPIEEREEKKYRLRLKAAECFKEPHVLCLNKYRGEFLLSNAKQTENFQTVFTQEEIDEMPFELVELFDKIEV